ncbi:MAG: hypothetical protein PHF74_01825 [Dehalococcoidales bacterium]|nr:hypothetical protein [Dehalococcoidales bacterium]
MKNIILTAVIVVLVATSSILGYFYADTSNELSTTKLQLNAANAQITSLQSQLSTTNAQVTSLQTQLDTASAQVISLQTQLSTANSQVTSLQSQLTTANAQVTSLENQLSTASSQVTSLQAQLTTANTQVTSLENQLSTASSQIASLQAQLTTANAQIASLQAQLDSVQPARHFNTKSELTSWLNSLPSSLKNWNSFSNALARQNKAAEDGYIYSVYVSGDYWGEEAIAGNTLYWIDSDGSLVSLGTIS